VENIDMKYPGYVFNLLASCIVMFWGFLYSQDGAHAIDLKAAKAPLHYECQTTLSGGLIKNETGNWTSGSLKPHSDKYRIILERFDDTRGKRKKDCTSEERRTGGIKPRGEDFCMTFEYTNGNQKIEETRYCTITSISSMRQEFGSLICPLGSVFFDSDRLYGIQTDSPEFVELGMAVGRSVTADKFSCLRLDR